MKEGKCVVQKSQCFTIAAQDSYDSTGNQQNYDYVLLKLNTITIQEVLCNIKYLCIMEGSTNSTGWVA